MPDVTLLDAAREFLDSLDAGGRAAHQAEVQRFVRWAGADRACTDLRGQEVANYAETLTGGVSDANARADSVKRFLAFAKKAGYTETNLGAHLRLKKSGGTSHARARPVTIVEMTAEQKAALEAEVEALKAQRPQILRDIQRARADKDFRENAPLDAARDRQAHLESRIREIETKLAHAVIIDAQRSPTGDGVEIGSTVHLRNLQSGKETTYTLVRPGEVDASHGRISFESPVGKALLERRPGDEVEVAAPSGTIRFRIERIETS